MEFMIKTKNTTYELKDGMTHGTCIINGGAFHDVEIHRPTSVLTVGEPFQFIVTNHPSNGSLQNRIMSTSPIESFIPKANENIMRPLMPKTNENIMRPNLESKIKNPFSLMLAFAKNQLIHHFSTKNSKYSLTPVSGNENVMMLSGGKLRQAFEVIKPKAMPNVGEKLILTCTNNPINGRCAGEKFSSSLILEKSFGDKENHLYTEEEVMGTHFSSIEIQTKNSTYTLTPVYGKENVMQLSGGKTPFPLEVYAPTEIPQAGGTLTLTYTDNPSNGNFANGTFRTSRIHGLTVNADKIAENSGKFKVSYPSEQSVDFGSQLQGKASDIGFCAADTLGLPEEQKQEIYVTPSIASGKTSFFQVAYSGFPTDANGIHAVQTALDDELYAHGCNHYQFGTPMPVSHHELDMMRDVLSEQALHLGKYRIVDNTPVQSEISSLRAYQTPYIPTQTQNQGPEF